MASIGLMFLIFFAALTGLVFLSNVYTRYCLKSIVVRKLEWLDFVQETQMVPPDWRTRHEKAMAKAVSNESRLQKLKETALSDYLRRLDKLMEFVEVCTLIPSDAERGLILNNLKTVRQNWKENDDAVFTSALYGETKI